MRTQAVESLKIRLDGFVECATWDSPDIIDHTYCRSEVIDCIIYYIVGFVCKKRKSFTNCSVCEEAFLQKDNVPLGPEAHLTIIKNRGLLVHPNMALFQILKVAERHFSRNVLNSNVFEKTDNCILREETLSFPCNMHKCDVLSRVIHYYITLRMRQFSKIYNQKLGQSTRERRKQAKLIA